VSVRIVIADDHEVVRRGMRVLLESHPDWEVVGETANGREAVEMATALAPDVVVLDVTMPELNGLEATRRIRAAVPGAEVLVLTVHESEPVVREVLDAGARGYVLKSDAGHDLVAAVEALCHHRPFFTSPVATMVLEGYLGRPARTFSSVPSGRRLTSRESEVVQLLAEGRSNKEVAETLGISVKTAEAHRSNVMRKLDLHSISELVRYAVRNKMVEP
jgi:DNA-binding NarL/FixJ family response regulator